MQKTAVVFRGGGGCLLGKNDRNAIYTPDNNIPNFSKQTVGIFESMSAEYGTFDILTDDEVRQVPIC